LAWNPKGTSALIVAAPATPAATSNAAAAIVMFFVKLVIVFTSLGIAAAFPIKVGHNTLRTKRVQPQQPRVTV
jgi:hypothetical protein